MPRTLTLIQHLIHCLVLNKVINLVDISGTTYSQRNIITENDVASEHEYTFKSRNQSFNKDLGLKGKYCYHPFNTITVDGNGDVFACVCQAWLPISLGKIWDFESLTDITHSIKAREIQASILDGTYKYCDDNTCSIIKEKALSGRIDHRPDTVNWINFALDSSCNLTCPSCRSEFKFISEGSQFDQRIRIADHLIKLIQSYDHWIKFTLSGDGDPFASLIYRHFLSNLNLKGKHTVEIELVTNGILAKAHWHKLENIHKNIVRTKLSFDAGTEAVYNITRKGGDWNKLLESAEFIIKWKLKNYSVMSVMANFVVQTSNYKDMPAYVDLCARMGFDEINFQKIDDWGTFKDYNQHAVWKSTHPEFSEFLKYLNHPSLNNKKVNLTNLSDIKYEA